ncbi:MAG: hypothetical protein ACP5EN_10225 [Rhodovulum sp.]
MENIKPIFAVYTVIPASPCKMRQNKKPHSLGEEGWGSIAYAHPFD